MITVDGQKSQLLITDFANLEEILMHLRDLDIMEGRILTDLIINGVPFTEIYPHQSEDVASNTINTIEVITVPTKQMILDIVVEMYKVVELIKKGAAEISHLCREGDDTAALELLQDLLDVIRDFRKMQNTLETSLSGVDMTFDANDDQLNKLLTEMNDVLSEEDWILLADLFEYEFIPFCNKWKEEVDILKKNLDR